MSGMYNGHLYNDDATSDIYLVFCFFSIKILVTSLSGGPSQKGMFTANSGHLPPPYYHVYDKTLHRANHSVVILLAILCLGILLLNFAINFLFFNE